MAEYIQEISQQAMSDIIEAIRQFREDQFKDARNLPYAIAALLQNYIDGKEFQEFAVNHYSQIVNIIIDKMPRFLAIKTDLKGRMYFQVDKDIVEVY